MIDTGKPDQPVREAKAMVNTEPERIGRWWLFEDGTLLPVISGGDGDDDNSDDDSDDDDDGNLKPDPADKLTTKDIQRIMAREKREGKKAGRKEMAKELGFESVEDLEAAISAHRQAEERDKSDIDKERDKAAKERQAAEAERADARREKFETRCERALLRHGCPEEIVAKASRLIDLTPDDNPEFEDVLDAVEKLKEEMPQLFTAESSGEGKMPDSDPKRPPRQQKKEKTPAEEAAEMFARRHPEKVKTS